MQGIQGSILGMPLHEPYLLGCLNGRNELSLISYGQSGGHHDCQLMKLQDLRPAGQAQVQGGLPGGTLDQAEAQLRKLLAESLLPPARRRAPLASGHPAPTPEPAPPAPTRPHDPSSTSRHHQLPLRPPQVPRRHRHAPPPRPAVTSTTCSPRHRLPAGAIDCRAAA